MRHAHFCLVAILLLHAGGTALNEAYFWLYVPDSEGLAEAAWMTSPLVYWVPLVTLLFIWCAIDAKDRHVRLPLGVMLFVSLLFPIGVPYYYWRTYPRRVAYVHIGFFMIFAAACVAALWVGRKLAFHYFLTVA